MSSELNQSVYDHEIMTVESQKTRSDVIKPDHALSWLTHQLYGERWNNMQKTFDMPYCITLSVAIAHQLLVVWIENNEMKISPR